MIVPWIILQSIGTSFDGGLDRREEEAVLGKDDRKVAQRKAVRVIGYRTTMCMWMSLTNESVICVGNTVLDQVGGTEQRCLGCLLTQRTAAR